MALTRRACCRSDGWFPVRGVAEVARGVVLKLEAFLESACRGVEDRAFYDLQPKDLSRDFW